MNFSPFLLFLVVVSRAFKRIFFLSKVKDRAFISFVVWKWQAFFSELKFCKSSALFRSLSKKSALGLYGGNNNLTTDRQLSTRTAPDLKSFVVDKIQTSATLSPSDKESLLQDFFNLLYRNGAMGGLLKDLFGINEPAPEPSKVFDMLIN